MTGPLWTRLPDGWLTGRVKNVATVTLGKMLQSKDGGSDVSAPYMRAANVQPDGLLALDDVNEMWFGEAELEQLSIRAGDVVVVEGGQGGFGRAAYVENDLPGWGFQNSINRLRPIGDFDGRFIVFYLIALRASGYIRAYSNVVSMPHLTAEKLARVPIPLPPVEQQRAIADYLDRETARIDTLIEEQQRLIEMLRERRAAVIAGEFDAPATGRLRYAIQFAQTGPFGTQLSAEEYVEDGVPVVNPTHIKRGAITPDAMISVTPEKAAELRRHQLEVGDIVLGRKGEVDKSALVSEAEAGYICGSDSMLLRPSEDVDPSYLWWFFQSPESHSQLEQWSVGSTVAGLNQTTISRIVLPLPSVVEQRRIAQHLDEQIAKTDALIAETERFVELARERRSALITAAVTGQMDVGVMA
ncbi:restriction endonuclease subunit S [Nonomuraea soli]|uniref:Type I restriction enzyme S subunit n=1 Tax=Nonomuraea soli TaxID=1032476 RepID=A0A7W0CJJ0_9ACTN|nr:restriction endonuclease subunit S [Nonomuraea soli]MBA2892377.1 type I restriction enzyme S subunit [Nonomuraea soli]